MISRICFFIPHKNYYHWTSSCSFLLSLICITGSQDNASYFRSCSQKWCELPGEQKEQYKTEAAKIRQDPNKGLDRDALVKHHFNVIQSSVRKTTSLIKLCVFNALFAWYCMYQYFSRACIKISPVQNFEALLGGLGEQGKDIYIRRTREQR